MQNVRLETNTYKTIALAWTLNPVELVIEAEVLLSLYSVDHGYNCFSRDDHLTNSPITCISYVLDKTLQLLRIQNNFFLGYVGGVGLGANNKPTRNIDIDLL